MALCCAALQAAAPIQALDPDKAFHHYVRNTWSIQEGLPQISVQAITQDHQGYIWVGTQAGVARFDGIRFTSYTPENEPALPGIWMRSLLTGRDGRVWIGTYKGLAVFQDGRFRSIPAADPKRFPVLDIYALLEDGESLIAATASGVFELRGGRLSHREGSPPSAQSLLKHGDELWVGSIGGATRMQAGRTEFLALPATAAAAAVTRLVEYRGQIWAGTTLGIFVRDGERWRIGTEHPAVRDSPTTMLFEDRDHNLWIGSNAGLARMRDGVITEYMPESSTDTIRGVITAYQDRENNLWLGSQWEGLTRVWNGWTRRYSSIEGLNEPIVWSLARAPDGRTWVGTKDGLSVFADGRFQQVLRGDQLPHPHAYNLFAEADRVWIGTRRGLVVWRNGRLESPPELAPLASQQINGILRDRHGLVWIGASEGLYRLDAGVLSHYGQAEGLHDVRVRQVRELRNGRLLVSTQDGLYEWRSGHMVQLGLDSGLKPGMDVTAMTELRDGELVIGTLAENVYLFDGHRWQEFGPDQGVPANAPFFLTEDEDGTLWIAGIRGITRARIADMRRLQRGEIHRVAAEMVLNERGDRLSGQQGFCCNGAGNAKGFLDHGVLWLPTRDGVVTLDTHGVVKNTVPATVVIERLRYGDHWHDAGASQAVKLPAASRDIAFEFTALSFQDPRSVGIRYRLLGYDRDWRDLQLPSLRSVNYTNLPAGDYVFEVKASNNAGVWNRTPAQLALSIKPYFQETAVFRGLAIALLGTIIYAGYRQQRRNFLTQRTDLERQVAERTHELHTANLQLEHASQTDPLTGLRNRRYLANQIPADLAFYDREQARSGNNDHTLLFALVDIDHFKRVNDLHGHKAGDAVLQQVAQVMTRLVRVGDYVARWGGEEFLLVFRPIPRQYVAVLAERVRRSVAEQAFDVGNGQHLPLTCSIGLAEYPLFRGDGQQLGWEQMVELADAALYWVKANGRDGWAELQPTGRTDLPTLITDLRSGAQALIDSGRLAVLTSLKPTPDDVAPG